MKEPVPSPPTEPAPPPDDGRCRTEALDLGAVLAIERAAQGARLARQEARPPAPPHPAETGPSSPRPAAPAVAVAPAAAVTPVAVAHAPVEARGHAELSPRPTRVLPGGTEPSAQSPSPAPASMKTLEIDYSPASRLHRTRSLQVQRAARVAVIGAVVAAVGIGLWALLSGGRGVVPAATHQIAIAPAPSVAPQAPSAQAPSTQTMGVPATTTVTAPASAPASTLEPSAAPTGASRPASTPGTSLRPSPSSTQAPRPRVKTPPLPTSDFPNQ